MKKTTLFLVLFYTASLTATMLYINEKDAKVRQCVMQTEGTDADCEACYHMAYGHYPKD